MTDSLVIPSDPFVDMTAVGVSVCLHCILTPSYGWLQEKNSLPNL